MVVGATPWFCSLMRHGAGSGYSGLYSSFSPAPGGRSHHSDPWREGHRVDQKPLKTADYTRSALRQKEASLGNAHHPIASNRSTGDVPLNPTPSDFPSLALTPHPKLILGRLRRPHGFHHGRSEYSEESDSLGILRRSWVLKTKRHDCVKYGVSFFLISAGAVD